MDADVKYQRLMQTRHFIAHGPNFSDRLEHFKKTSIKWRNKLAHNWPIIWKNMIYFNQISTWPTRLEDVSKMGMSAIP